MTRKSKIALIIMIIMLLSTIFSSGRVLSLQKSESNNNTKILNNIEREKNIYNEQLEITVQKYSKSKDNLVNDNSKQALKIHNLAYNDIYNSNDIEVIKDITLDRIVNRVKTEKAQIDFDQEGNIVKLINNEDISIIDKNKKNYTKNSKLKDIEYKFTSKNDIQKIINDVINAYNLQEYKIVNCHNDLIGTWSVTWNKILFDDIVNPYDVACITIDAKDGSINMFSRNTIEPNTINLIVTEDEAINYAKPIIDKLNISGNISTTLTTFRPNFYWEENGPYKEANFIRLAWKISLADKTTIMIDAETGEILGGDKVLGTDGARAMTVDPTLYGASGRTSAAATAFSRLGYIQPSGCTPYTGWVTKEDIMWVITHPSLYGLYLSCHGVVDQYDNFLNKVTANGNWFLSSSEVTGNWHFVYLEACKTSSNSSFPSAFNTVGYQGRCFVGHNNSVLARTCYEFTTRFFSKLGYMSVYSAVIQARDETLAAGYDSCNPGFWGDSNYYGWAW